MAESANGVKGELRRDAKIIGLLFASTTSMIGSGWLFGAYHASKIAGPLAIWSWVVGRGDHPDDRTVLRRVGRAVSAKRGARAYEPCEPWRRAGAHLGLDAVSRLCSGAGGRGRGHRYLRQQLPALFPPARNRESADHRRLHHLRGAAWRFRAVQPPGGAQAAPCQFRHHLVEARRAASGHHRPDRRQHPLGRLVGRPRTATSSPASSPPCPRPASCSAISASARRSISAAKAPIRASTSRSP